MIQKIWKSLVIVGFLTLASTSSPMGRSSVARAQSAAPDRYAKNSYPEEFVTNYLRNCNAQSQQEGLTPQQAQMLCQCTIDEYQARFSIEEFAGIIQKLQQTGETPDELLDVGLTCSAKLQNNN